MDTAFNDDIVIIVGIIVDSVFYLVAVIIKLSFQRSPAVADVCRDADDLERCEESVLDVE